MKSSFRNVLLILIMALCFSDLAHARKTYDKISSIKCDLIVALVNDRSRMNPKEKYLGYLGLDLSGMNSYEYDALYARTKECSQVFSFISNSMLIMSIPGWKLTAASKNDEITQREASELALLSVKESRKATEAEDLVKKIDNLRQLPTLDEQFSAYVEYETVVSNMAPDQQERLLVLLGNERKQLNERIDKATDDLRIQMSAALAEQDVPRREVLVARLAGQLKNIPKSYSAPFNDAMTSLGNGILIAKKQIEERRVEDLEDKNRKASDEAKHQAENAKVAASARERELQDKIPECREFNAFAKDYESFEKKMNQAVHDFAIAGASDRTCGPIVEAESAITRWIEVGQGCFKQIPGYQPLGPTDQALYAIRLKRDELSGIGKEACRR